MNVRLLRVSEVSEETLRRWASELDDETRARLSALRTPEARLRSLCADRLARTMLAEHCGCEMQSLTFLREKNGKPYAVGVPFFFNVSHSGEFVACAVDAQPVGIDVEVLRPVRPALARRVCCAEELAFVAPSGQFDSARFLQLWTAKEACLKRSGQGIFAGTPKKHDIFQALRQTCVVRGGVLAVPALHLQTCCTADYALSVVCASGASATAPQSIGG